MPNDAPMTPSEKLRVMADDYDRRETMGGKRHALANLASAIKTLWDDVVDEERKIFLEQTRV